MQIYIDLLRFLEPFYQTDFDKYVLDTMVNLLILIIAYSYDTKNLNISQQTLVFHNAVQCAYNCDFRGRKRRKAVVVDAAARRRWVFSHSFLRTSLINSLHIQEGKEDGDRGSCSSSAGSDSDGEPPLLIDVEELGIIAEGLRPDLATRSPPRPARWEQVWQLQVNLSSLL